MKKFFLAAVIFISKFIVVYSLISASVLVVFRFIDPADTAFMQQKSGAEFPYLTGWMKAENESLPLSKISPSLINAVVASEDQLFYEHWGFDFHQIDEAISDYRKKDKLRGASTITQQLAKNLFLSPERNIFRKGAEAYFTVLIEIIYSKERILELYLNHIEWGENIYGAESAAHYYFNKTAVKLTEQDAAFLAAIIPNPQRLAKTANRGYIERRKKQIIEQMKNLPRRIQAD